MTPIGSDVRSRSTPAGRAACALVVLLVTFSVCAQPRPKPDFKYQRRDRDDTRASVADLKEIGPMSFDDLVHVSVDGGSLSATSGILIVPRQDWVRVRLFNEPRDEDPRTPRTVWRVQTQDQMAHRGWNRFAPEISICRYDFEPAGDDVIWSTTLHVNPSRGIVELTAHAPAYTVSYYQRGRTAVLRVSPADSASEPSADCESDSLYGLKAEYPAEVRKFLAPVIARFTPDNTDLLRPGPTDIYMAFPDLPADATATAAVRDIVPRLDAVSPADRQAALADLKKLGHPALLALARMDRNSLTPQEKAAVASLLASERRYRKTPADMRKDLQFLADCLEFDDPAVRRAAKTVLEQRLGHPLENFDPTLSGESLYKAVDAVRAKFPSE